MRQRVGWLGAIAGGLIGLGLGLAIGYCGRSPMFGGTIFGYIVIPLAIGLVVGIVFLVWVGLSRSTPAVVGLALLLLAGFAGVWIAPTPPGGFTSGRGSVTIGTPSEPRTYLEGSATCEWVVGGPYVTDVGGFAWPVSDPALFEALDLAGPASVERVHLGTGARPIGSEADIEFGEGQGARSGSFVAFDLVSVASDGRTGTAVSKDRAVQIAWTCPNGP